MFDYYYGNECEAFSFVQIPRVMFTDKEHFGELSNESKLLYALLHERMTLSKKNQWIKLLHKACHSSDSSCLFTFPMPCLIIRFQIYSFFAVSPAMQQIFGNCYYYPIVYMNKDYNRIFTYESGGLFITMQICKAVNNNDYEQCPIVNIVLMVKTQSISKNR